MNNNNREKLEELDAQRTAEVLESGAFDTFESVEENKTAELGRWLRQSVEHDLPPSNDSLREQLLAELSEGDVPMAPTKTLAAKDEYRVSRKRMWMAIPAGVLLMAGGWFMYSDWAVPLAQSNWTSEMPDFRDRAKAAEPSVNVANTSTPLAEPEAHPKSFGVDLRGGIELVNELEMEKYGYASPGAGPGAGGNSDGPPSGEGQKPSPRFVPRNGQQGQGGQAEQPGEKVLDDSVLNWRAARRSPSFGSQPSDSLGVQNGTRLDSSRFELGFGESKPEQSSGSQQNDRMHLLDSPAEGSLAARVEHPPQSNPAPDMGGLGGIGGGGFGGGGGGLGGGGRGLAAKGMTIGLPALQETKRNTVVSVPDGGTILMGGVKRMREDRYSSEGKSAEFDGKKHKGYFEVPSGGEQYAPIHENLFVQATGGSAISTFSIDVDTASYANMRRFLSNGQRPPRDSVRIEELVNYFQYNYPQPTGEDPFSVNMELAACPWNQAHKLLRVGLKGKEIHVQERPATNLVYLIDVSGSMNSQDKLPLLKSGFQMMTKQLGENDRVSIVTYAGNAGVALEPTTGEKTKTIHEAIERLTSGGSTHGSAGIQLAYELAQKNFIQDGVNKVILATDGDLNVGVTDDNSLVKLIKQKASEGVFLTVLGFGTGNLKDAKLEKIADNGNGHYAYIDSNREAHRVLVQQMSGSLVTIAKDVKIQIEFNPAEVSSYRLIGYENRMLATKDFDDDRKDAGEIGAGHTVTAIYEIEPTGGAGDAFTAPTGMKYQAAGKVETESADEKPSGLTDAAANGELATVALRYKKPDENESKRIEFAIKNEEQSFGSASEDFRFAASVAGFGMLLRGSEYSGDATAEKILQMASDSIGDDASGYRAEFIDLVRKACYGQ